MNEANRKYFAEFVGTFFLVFFGVGSAVFGIDMIGAAGVAATFGLVLLAMAYGIGPLTGCHINPAVTLGVLLSKGMSLRDAIGYWIAQFVGAIAGAALIRGLVGFGDVKDQTGGLGTNDWGARISGPGAFVLEIVFGFLFVFVILLVTGRAAAPGFAGLAIGLTLTVIHLVGVPLDGTSVNPARSLGPALFNGGTPLDHVWLFIIASPIGAAIAALLAPLVNAATPPTPARTDPTGADPAAL